MTPTLTEEAERAALERLRPWLRTVARSLLRPDEYRFADDLAQEGWVAAWKALRGPRAGADRDWWCKRQALSRMRTVRRDLLMTGKARQHLLTDDPGALLELADDLGAVELAYHRGRVWEAIESLAHRRGEPSYRLRAGRARQEYVLRRFWLGQGPGEVERAMGLDPGKGHDLWRWARESLRVELAELAGLVTA